MPRPTSRLLAFLEMLQAAPSVSGREAADQLGVDVRTVRRYAVSLHDLGIPVDGQRGAGGGYRLRPGYRLPPLMLADDEAAAVVFGLASARRLGLAAAEPALDKVLRVLPPTLKRRVDALERTVSFTSRPSEVAPPPLDALLTLNEAVRRRRRVRLGYTSFSGEQRERELEPYGVVVHAGRWYAAARNLASGELRTYRVDRMRDVVLGGPGEAPPEGFDPVSHVARSLARIPWPWQVEVVIDARQEELARRIPATMGELEPVEGGTRLRIGADSLAWVAELLAGLGRPFRIVSPEELRLHVREVARTLERAAAAGSPAG